MSNPTREEMLSVISDLSKEACGYRVRLNYSEMSDDELARHWNSFCDMADEKHEEEQIQQNNAWSALNAYFDNLTTTHGIDRATALRWDLEAEDAKHGGQYDIGFYCYRKGIAYSHQDELKALLN